MTTSPRDNALTQIFGPGARFDEHSRGLYATDASIYQVSPKGVIEARRTEDVLNAVQAAAKHGIPILPRGGGTSLAGQCVNDAVVIDLSSGCDRILNVDQHARTCRVEAGVTLEDLNDHLHPTGLFFAPDPSTARQATVAGCIGNNAAGAHSVLYGRTSESVIAVDACLANGERVTFGPSTAAQDPRVMGITQEVAQTVLAHERLIDERYPKTPRRSAGYQLDVVLAQLREHGGDPAKINLAPLLCGSEGTLALTLGAELALHPIPTRKGLALVVFPSVLDAIAAVEPLLELGPASIELLDELILELAMRNREYKHYVDLLPKTVDGGIPKAVLYVEFFADSLDELSERMSRVADAARDGAVSPMTDPGEMARAWKLRKAGEPLLHAVEGERKPIGFIEDNAIPVDRLGEFVERLRAIVEGEGTVASYYAHASVGVLHVRPLLDLRDPSDEHAMHRIADATADLAKELGGVASGEHGDGRARGPFLERFFGPELMQAHRHIKSIFDPQKLFNPGNIVDPKPLGSISQNTRVRPAAVPLTIERVDTGFRYDTEGGFAHAVEMCNGAGLCRKKSVGTMCPSYQGTREERHSTRGRGNALRRAISGQSNNGDQGGDPDFSDPETLETLKLCLSCKACKTECPSSVDVAKLKSEYLHQHHARHGVPLAARALSRVHTLNRLACLAPALSNAVNRFAPTRSALNHALGLAPDRSLPVFRRPVKPTAFKEYGLAKAVFVSDTMTTHTEPWIAHAAVGALETLGYDVMVHTVSDLARSAISQGTLGYAGALATKEFRRLAAIRAQSEAVPLLFAEPSMLSAVLDDWGDLLPETALDTWRDLQGACEMTEAFIARRWDQHPKQPSTRNDLGGVPIRVHTHCHQKSLMGSETSLDALERLAPGRVELIDAGCCGMSGAFGYKRDTSPLAKTIANQRLIPDVNEHAEASIVLASGTSCRHMVLDESAVHAAHPIEAVAAMLGVKGTRPEPLTPGPPPGR